jgi:hypothetical protein
VRFILIAGMLALGLLAGEASAHHSPSMFDMARRLEISGTVRQFQWTNPHSYIQLVDAGGTEWSFEMGAPYILMGQGWTRNSLRPGDQVRINYSPLRHGGNAGLVLAVISQDGRPVGGRP